MESSIETLEKDLENENERLYSVMYSLKRERNLLTDDFTTSTPNNADLIESYERQMSLATERIARLKEYIQEKQAYLKQKRLDEIDDRK